MKYFRKHRNNGLTETILYLGKHELVQAVHTEDLNTVGKLTRTHKRVRMQQKAERVESEVMQLAAKFRKQEKRAKDNKARYAKQYAKRK